MQGQNHRSAECPQNAKALENHLPSFQLIFIFLSDLRTFQINLATYYFILIYFIILTLLSFTDSPVGVNIRATVHEDFHIHHIHQESDGLRIKQGQGQT